MTDPICKGVCPHARGQEFLPPLGSWERCTICHSYFLTNILICPCCGDKLKSESDFEYLYFLEPQLLT